MRILIVEARFYPHISDALYDGAFTLVEALAASGERFDPYTWGPPQP